MLKKFPELAIYLHPKIIAIAFLGFSSGLPKLLVLSTLTVWLTEVGIDRTTIGLLVSVSTPYAFKFLWAPFIDHLKVPLMSNLFGRRLGWLFTLQILLSISIIILGMSSPDKSIMITAVLALIVSFLSASQDIVIDAYRVEILNDSQQGAGAASIVFGYRIGMLVSSAGALFIATYSNWFITYLIMGILIFIGGIAAFFAKEPKLRIKTKSNSMSEWLKHAAIDPFLAFSHRKKWYLLLIFFIFYKFGDAFASVMSNNFYLDIGFTKIQIAAIVKIFGFGAVLLGAFIGGSLIIRFGIYKSLFICGILQMVSTAVFAALAIIGNNLSFLAFTIAFENLSSGMGTAAFVAYMSHLCQKEYTATQYALYTSFSAFGLSIFSTPSGWVVDQVGWIIFFIISGLIAIPALFMCLYLKNFEKFTK